MKENIKQINEFHCPICDFITRNQTTIDMIRKTDKCPACNNGKSASYQKKYELVSPFKRKVRGY